MKLVMQVLSENAVDYMYFLALFSVMQLFGDGFCSAFSLDCRCSDYIWSIGI